MIALRPAVTDASLVRRELADRVAGMDHAGLHDHGTDAAEAQVFAGIDPAGRLETRIER